MNNCANFYKNRPNRSMFSTKRRMWRHVKTDDVIIPSKISESVWIFIWLFKVKMTNRDNFYKNRPIRSMFSKKTSHMTSPPKNDDVIATLKMSESIRFFCGKFLLLYWITVTIFGKFCSLEPYFLHTRHFVEFWSDCRQKKCRQWRHVDPTYIFVVLFDVRMPNSHKFDVSNT